MESSVCKPCIRYAECEEPLHQICMKIEPKWMAFSSLFYDGQISCRIEVTRAHQVKKDMVQHLFNSASAEVPQGLRIQPGIGTGIHHRQGTAKAKEPRSHAQLHHHDRNIQRSPSPSLVLPGIREVLMGVLEQFSLIDTTAIVTGGEGCSASASAKPSRSSVVTPSPPTSRQAATSSLTLPFQIRSLDCCKPIRRPRSW